MLNIKFMYITPCISIDSYNQAYIIMHIDWSPYHEYLVMS